MAPSSSTRSKAHVSPQFSSWDPKERQLNIVLVPREIQPSRNSSPETTAYSDFDAGGRPLSPPASEFPDDGDNATTDGDADDEGKVKKKNKISVTRARSITSLKDATSKKVGNEPSKKRRRKPSLSPAAARPTKKVKPLKGVTSTPATITLLSEKNQELYGAASEAFPNTKAQVLHFIERDESLLNLFKHETTESEEIRCLAKARLGKAIWMVGKVGVFCGGDESFRSFHDLEAHVRKCHLGIQGDMKQWLKAQKERLKREEKDDCPLFLTEDSDADSDDGGEPKTRAVSDADVLVSQGSKLH